MELNFHENENKPYHVETRFEWIGKFKTLEAAAKCFEDADMGVIPKWGYQ